MKISKREIESELEKNQSPKKVKAPGSRPLCGMPARSFVAKLVDEFFGQSLRLGHMFEISTAIISAIEKVQPQV